MVDHAVDLMSLRPGDRLEIPYEMTVTETMQEFWHAAFHAQDRIHTSRPFCRTMGLQDRVIPFSLALFLTSSMTHADAAKVQVGFGHVWYLWPTFAGDTFRKSFEVNTIRNTSDGSHSIIHFTCDLHNHRGRLCMRADKRMLFSFTVPESNSSSSSTTPAMKEPDQAYLFRDHLLSKANTVLAEQPSHTLTRFHPGQCILHSMNRSLTFSQSQQLASLARLTHERHFDTKKYDRYSEIWIPGGLVLGLTMSASARDMHEILHEEIVSVNYVNNLSPDQIVGAVSYIERVEDNNVPGDLEVLTVRTLGIKNMNVKRDLEQVGIPVELFFANTPKEIESICKQHCPVLMNKIVVQVVRKVLRQSCREQVFLL
jgi:acyl dehydratase